MCRSEFIDFRTSDRVVRPPRTCAGDNQEIPRSLYMRILSSRLRFSCNNPAVGFRHLCPRQFTDSQLNTNVVEFGIKVEGMDPAFASNSRKAHAPKGSAQIAQKPAINPGDADIHPLCYAMSPFQITRPDRSRQPILSVVSHADPFFF